MSKNEKIKTDPNKNMKDHNGSVLDAKVSADEDKAFYRVIFDKSTAPTIVVEEDYIISKINERLENLLGYSKEELEGKVKWTSLVPESDLAMMMKYHQLRRIDPDAAPKEYECHFKGKTGRVFNIQIKMDMIPGTTTSVGTLIDITEKKEAEKNLLERETELSAIVENFPGYIYTSKVDYSLEFMNKMLSDKIGQNNIIKRCYDTFFGFETPCPWCENEKVFSGETIRTEFCAPDDNRWYDMVSTPIFDSKGKVIKRQTILIDITAQKLAAEALKNSANQLKEENIRLKLTMKDRYRFGSIVGKSSEMQKVYDLILRAAASESNVIIYGESGTGKELVAKEIHRLSKRSKEAFVPVNCGAIPTNLMESEFFGYKKGAFTGATSDKKGYLELAEGGTLFLDELGEIEQSMQVKLLRVIEGGGFIALGGKTVEKPDIKIIAATNQNVLEMISQGKMREDFFYRIHVIPIHLPPLRERKTDIPLLIEYFMKSKDKGADFPEIDSTFIEALLKYNWPGNVRELQNALNRYLALEKIDFIYDFTPPRSPAPLVSDPEPLISGRPTKLKSAMAELEKELIKKVLIEKKWHRGKTAEALGINRRTLQRRMAVHKLDDTE